MKAELPELLLARTQNLTMSQPPAHRRAKQLSLGYTTAETKSGTNVPYRQKLNGI
jgi:hypothetical protein